MPLQFCPFCGQALIAADARFCASCGRAFPATSTEAPAAPYGASSVSGAAPAPAYLTGAAPVAVATAAPQVFIVRSLKSRGVAAALEFFIPGAGAMYAGKVALGLLWLLVAAGLQVGGPAIVVKTASSAYDGLYYPSDPSYAPAAGPQFAGRYLNSQRVNWLIVLSVLAVIWLIVRMVLATRFVDRANRTITTGVSPQATGGSFVGLPARAWVCGLFAVILLSGPSVLAHVIGGYFFRFGDTLVAVPGLLFFLALMRFVRTEARRAATEVGVAAGVVAALAAITGSIRPQGLAVFLVLCALAIGLAAGCVTGFGRPPLRGPQSEVHDMICLLVVIVLVMVATYFRPPLILRIGIAAAIAPAALVWAAVVLSPSRRGAMASGDASGDHALEVSR